MAENVNKALEKSVSVQPINFSVATSTFPNSGAKVDLDSFLTVPQDSEFDQGFIFFDGVSDTGNGTIEVLLVQSLDGGGELNVSAPIILTLSDGQPIKLGRSEARLRPERPLFLRFRVSPNATGTVWWSALSSCRGTINLLAR